jgi:hypothetical protein
VLLPYFYLNPSLLRTVLLDQDDEDREGLR